MENLWKVEDVAAAINVSTQTVYRYVANGEIPFSKFMRAVRFSPAEIRAWVESRKSGTVTATAGNITGGLMAETVTLETGTPETVTAETGTLKTGTVVFNSPAVETGGGK